MVNVAVICLPTKETIEVCVVDYTEVLWRESVPKTERSIVDMVKQNAACWATENGLNVISLTQLAENAQ